MGVIQRQSIKQSIVNYIGVGIGAISTIFIYPLNEEIYGLALFLLGTASFFAPFSTFGIPALTVRFFPHFKSEENKHHGFLSFLIIGTIIGIVLFSLFLLLFGPAILNGLEKFKFNSNLIREYFWQIGILCLLIIYQNLLSLYTSNFNRIVVPGIFKDFFPKLFLPVLVLLSFLGILSKSAFVNYFLGLHFIILLGITGYLVYLGQFHLNISFERFKKPLPKQMFSFALFGIMGSIGTILAFRIDSIMVSTLVDLSKNGIYHIALFMGNSIEMPTRALYAIASPIIASSIKENDWGNVKKIYTRSSINLLIVGLLVFICIWISIEDIFQLTSKPELLMNAKYVVFWIAMAKLIDMGTSVNSYIISYSKYYRFNLYAVLFLGVSNVLLNYFLIPAMGITGAAIATFVSLTLFNLIKVIYIYYRFRLLPFSKTTLLLILISGLTYFVVYIIPDFSYPLLNILKNFLLASLLFVPLYGPAL